MYGIVISFVRYGWASCSASPLTSEVNGFRPADTKINWEARTAAAGMPGVARRRAKVCRSIAVARSNDLGAASPSRAQLANVRTCRNASDYAFFHVSVPFWPRSVRRDHLPASEPSGLLVIIKM